MTGFYWGIGCWGACVPDLLCGQYALRVWTGLANGMAGQLPSFCRTLLASYTRLDFNTSTMRRDANPSPYGFEITLLVRLTLLADRNLLTPSRITLLLVPTKVTVPAETASGLSVVSRVTRTALPSEGASSWIPPESVIIRSQRLIR